MVEHKEHKEVSVDFAKWLADSTWLRLVERFAIPLIAVFLWAQYSDLQQTKRDIASIQAKLPQIDMQFKSLERVDDGVASHESRIVIIEQAVGVIQDTLKSQNEDIRFIRAWVEGQRGRAAGSATP
jgi:septal ring factor EnvC (AmiA/AmiB activator)